MSFDFDFRTAREKTWRDRARRLTDTDVSELSARIDAFAERLRPHYRRFLQDKEGQALLTAHSHQAWPDVAREAQLRAFDDAARWMDDKWGVVFEEVVPDFAALTCARLGSSRPDDLAFAPNTHELVYRLLSCFAPDARVVTTDGEFHSLRRQLVRSAEDGLRVSWVDTHEPASLVRRLLAAVDRERTDLVAVSQVFFATARVFTDLDALLEGLAERGVPVLVDVYHSFNALSLAIDRWPGTVFVTGGGYKYAQSGEGCCWLQLPAAATDFSPRHTGWFADFDGLEAAADTVSYGPGRHRFLGATFDPTSLYRSRAVLSWMDAEGLTPTVLREASLDRTQLLIEGYDELALAARGLGLATPRDPEARGGFVSFRRPDARQLKERLRERGVRTDARADLLRFGPAPYTESREIRQGLQVLSEIL